MHAAVIAPFTASDGENLALYEWPMDARASDMDMDLDAPPPRAMVVIVHGLGEHASRYQHVAHQLLDWGFAVRAYDQRGHGLSGGQRGVLPNEMALVNDLAEMVDDTRLRCARLLQRGSGSGSRRQPAGPAQAPTLPLILLGHSLGGLVASRFVALDKRPVEGLVLSSPALDPGFNALQRLLLGLMPRLAPNWCVSNGLDAHYLSHDPEVVKSYLTDRLVHGRISLRLGKFIADAGHATLAAAASWSTPSLLMYAGADRLVRPAGSRAFADAAASSPAVRSGMLTTQCFEGLYHELFNEADAAPVFDTLKAWLNARF